MTRKEFLRLYAPDAASGGGAAVAPDPHDTNPADMDHWMTGLGTLDGSPAISDPAQLRKEPDEPKTTGGTGNPPASGATAPAAKPAGDSNVPAADAAAKAAAAKAKADADASAAAKTKTGEVDDDKWPRSSGDWDKFKSKRDAKYKEFEGKLKESGDKLTAAEARIKELEKGSNGELPETFKNELELVKKERDELSERLQVVDVEQHPTFQAFYKEKVDEQISIAKEIIGDEKGAEFEKLIRQPASDERRRAIKEFVSDLDIVDQAQIGGVLNALSAIGRQRQSDIGKAQEKRKEMVQNQKDKLSAAIKKRDDGFNSVAKQFQDAEKGFAAYQLHEEKTDADRAWNKSVKERIEVARSILTGTNGVTPERVYEAALHSAAMPAILEAYKADMLEKNQEIAKLQEQVKGLSATQPNLGNGASADPGQNPPPRKELKVGMSPSEAMGTFVDGLIAATQ